MPWSMIDPIMDKSCFSFNNNSNFSRSFIDSFWLTTLESKFKSIQKSQIGKLHDEIRSEFLFIVSFPPKMMVFFHPKSAPLYFQNKIPYFFACFPVNPTGGASTVCLVGNLIPMYRGFDGAGLDGRKPIRKAEINGEVLRVKT